MGPCEALEMRINQNQCINRYSSFRALLSPHRPFTASKMPWFGIEIVTSYLVWVAQKVFYIGRNKALLAGFSLSTPSLNSVLLPCSTSPLGTHCFLAGGAGHISVSHSPFNVSCMRWSLCLVHSHLPSNTSRRVIHSCYVNAETRGKSSLRERPVKAAKWRWRM